MKRIFFFLVFVIAVAVITVPAQRRKKTGDIAKVAKVTSAKIVKPDGESGQVGTVPLPQAVLRQAEGNGEVLIPSAEEKALNTGDVQSGTVVVNVSSNANAVIKIGLAERAVTVIEFPVADPVFKIHPGDENFVTVDCSARDGSGKCGNSPTDAIVLRPGKSFHALGSEDAAATVVTVQRVSGIVVSFIVVPVKSISQNANYVVVRYGLNEVIEARRKAGLATELVPGLGVPSPFGAPGSKNAVFQDAKNGDGEVVAQNDPKIPEESLESLLSAEITKVAKSESGLQFSKPVHGISLAKASAFKSRTADITLEVVAVRNTLGQPIRLVPDQPALMVENRDKKSSSVAIEKVEWLYLSTTVEEDDILQPGRVYYFAFAYNSPILGVKQSLRVSFAQRDAADAPATMDLGAVAR
jgi:hypothetical protein